MSIDDSSIVHPSTRLERINKLIERLDADEDISLRDIKSLLPTPIKEWFETARAELKRDKQNARSHPKPLTEYNVMLRTADLMRGRLKSLKETDGEKLRDVYAAALDVLRDWQRKDSDVEHWFDREIDWEHIKPTYDGVPRCKFLRSGAAELKSIKSVKREYLVLGKAYIEQHHADELPKPMSADDEAKLKRLMAELMNRKR